LADDSGPYGITVGTDGALWFTTMTSGEIGRIRWTGVVRLVPSWCAVDDRHRADNALWFTLNQANAVGRLRRRRAHRARIATAERSVGITATHDDAVWFTR